MNITYVNYTIHGSSQQAVAAALAGRSAIVAPSRHGSVVAYDEESEHRTDIIEGLGAGLSGKLSCPVLAVFVYDDDVLAYWLFEGGKQTDKYDSNPSYFDLNATGPSAPSGGDARKLCATFGVQKAAHTADVEMILRKGSVPQDDYPFAIVKHAALCKAVGLPEFAVAAGYGHIAHGQMPAGLEEKDLIRVSHDQIKRPERIL